MQSARKFLLESFDKAKISLMVRREKKKKFIGLERSEPIDVGTWQLTVIKCNFVLFAKKQAKKKH